MDPSAPTETKHGLGKQDTSQDCKGPHVMVAASDFLEMMHKLTDFEHTYVVTNMYKFYTDKFPMLLSEKDDFVQKLGPDLVNATHISIHNSMMSQKYKTTFRVQKHIYNVLKTGTSHKHKPLPCFTDETNRIATRVQNKYLAHSVVELMYKFELVVATLDRLFKMSMTNELIAKIEEVHKEDAKTNVCS